MVPVPSCPLTWDYWTGIPSDYVELSCLMPNSMYISLKASWNSTLQELKEKLWDEASNYPLFGMLHDMSGYMFRFVNNLAVQEDIDDESKRLRDIRPVCGVLIIHVRPIKGPGEKDLNVRISHLIGKDVNEFDNLRSSEVNDFRSQMRMLAEESLLHHRRSNPLQQLQYKSPSRLAGSHIVPPTLLSHLNNHCFILSTKMANSDSSFSLNVPMMQTPQQSIALILKKAEKSLNIRTDVPSKYVLKVCGREEYLLPPDKPLIQFLYIQETLYRDDVPQVMTVHLDTLPLSPELPDPKKTASESTKNSNTLKRRNASVYSWNVNENYSCQVQSVGGLNVDPGRPVEVVCQAGIFHGGKSLCEAQKTRVTAVSKEGVAQWDEDLTFPIKVYNLPRMARLCFTIYEISKAKGKKKGKDSINKLAWANTMVFDYKQLLRVGGFTLFMWTHAGDETQGDDNLLHPLGTVVPNPNTDSCAAFQLRFSNYGCERPIQFPKEEAVRAYGEQIENGRPDAIARLQADFQRLRAAAEKDHMYEMHEQDRKDLWAARDYIRVEAPSLLAKLLTCVEWGERAEAAAAARLLLRWPRLDAEAALELLDYAYADIAVRSFAVKCLANISDEELLLYLLQLVQALKHESYLMCELAQFLLRRAFDNMTIGHHLFWHLRSEMHGPTVPTVTVRFGLLLEAYCRGCQDHINSLMRQVACLEKLKWVSQSVAKKKEISKARATLLLHLNEDHCKEAISDFVSPLNPSFICARIKVENCRVMDSKKRPLMLDFENSEPCGKDIRIILKIGDDLRQDMFTLQMLRIMDRIWKNDGYDFRLNPYNCISMEHGVGMIEVVEDAETVANIQKESALFNAASPISKTNLFQWLKKHNDTDAKLKKAIEEFTMSCAGYCVATYVLGIADRHPDNIMVKKNGQLFHIDFGHFLGKFKHKYGFKRERVPFVLTHDFIHVINRGQRGTGVNEPLDFKRFKEHCEEAFKILRKHGHLILSLFSMMISTGLPELSCEKDLQYLRDTLVMDLSEERAMEHFRAKFIEAVKKTWSTTFNWAIHNIDRNN